MEDLVPLLIFIVIAIANLFKFLADKGNKAKQAPPSGEAPPRRASSLESFFEDLAEKLEPEPTELPNWPESRKRPDYIHEMETFEHARAEAYEEEVSAEIIPMPPSEPIPVARETQEVPGIQSMDQTVSLKSAMKSMPAMITNSRGMRIASTPILRSSAAGRTHFPLQEKSTLRKAVIANIIFSTPRACDPSFDNTIAK